MLLQFQIQSVDPLMIWHHLLASTGRAKIQRKSRADRDWRLRHWNLQWSWMEGFAQVFSVSSLKFLIIISCLVCFFRRFNTDYQAMILVSTSVGLNVASPLLRRRSQNVQGADLYSRLHKEDPEDWRDLHGKPLVWVFKRLVLRSGQWPIGERSSCSCCWRTVPKGQFYLDSQVGIAIKQFRQVSFHFDS